MRGEEKMWVKEKEMWKWGSSGGWKVMRNDVEREWFCRSKSLDEDGRVWEKERRKEEDHLMKKKKLSLQLVLQQNQTILPSTRSNYSYFPTQFFHPLFILFLLSLSLSHSYSPSPFLIPLLLTITKFLKNFLATSNWVDVEKGKGQEKDKNHYHHKYPFALFTLCTRGESKETEWHSFEWVTSIKSLFCYSFHPIIPLLVRQFHTKNIPYLDTLKGFTSGQEVMYRIYAALFH